MHTHMLLCVCIFYIYTIVEKYSIACKFYSVICRAALSIAY